MREILLPLVAWLTYKSIGEALKAHDGTNLHLLESPERQGNGRKIYVSVGLLGVLQEVDDTYDGERHIALRDFLDAFSTGCHWTVSQYPHAKPRHAQLSRTHPTDAEVWSFRCLWPGHGMRVFGRFADMDCFIALEWDYRENLDEDDGWDAAIHECQSGWQALFWQFASLHSETHA
jgi:hypothetical protein